MKKIAIHQPNFLPWMGFFEKMKSVDQFVYLDHVAFSKGSYTNRVQYFCKSSRKKKWLTLPIQNAPLGTKISDIKLHDTGNWESKVIQTISQNINSPHLELIADTIRNRRNNSLADFNISLLTQLRNCLGIATPVIRSSQMDLRPSSEQVVLIICKELRAERYISGRGASNYLNKRAFAQNEIEFELCDYMELMRKNKKLDAETLGLTALYHL